MFFKKILISFFIIILQINLLFAEETKVVSNKKISFKFISVTEENLQFWLEKKGTVLIYFYSKWVPDSIKMKKIIEKTRLKQIKRNLIIDIDTNLGLKQTFNVDTLPAIVIIHNLKVIYGLTGYIDNEKILEYFIKNGLKTKKI